MTVTEFAELFGIACNIVLTALALMRACQARHDVNAIKTKMDI